MIRRLSLLASLILATVLPHRADAARSIVVSVPEQRLTLLEEGRPIASYPVSTSRFGLGDQLNSYRTPTGAMEIASRIGDNAPLGAVFKSRVRTGEVLKPNAAGRDPIVTRILWLRGKEACNSRAYDRGIYIHGTPVERLIGRPASYGCIRMRSADIVQLYDAVAVGTPIQVVNQPLARAIRESQDALAAANAANSAARSRTASVSGQPVTTAVVAKPN